MYRSKTRKSKTRKSKTRKTSKTSKKHNKSMSVSSMATGLLGAGTLALGAYYTYNKFSRSPNKSPEKVEKNILIIGMIPGERDDDVNKLGRANVFYLDFDCGKNKNDCYKLDFNEDDLSEHIQKYKFDEIYFDFSTIKFLSGKKMRHFFDGVYNILKKGGALYYDIHRNPGGMVGLKPNNKINTPSKYYEIVNDNLYYMVYYNGDPHKGFGTKVKDDNVYFKDEVLNKVVTNNQNYWNKKQCFVEVFFSGDKNYTVYPLNHPFGSERNYFKVTKN